MKWHLIDEHNRQLIDPDVLGFSVIGFSLVDGDDGPGFIQQGGDLTINRYCASGHQAIFLAAGRIFNDSESVVATSGL